MSEKLCTLKKRGGGTGARSMDISQITLSISAVGASHATASSGGNCSINVTDYNTVTIGSVSGSSTQYASRSITVLVDGASRGAAYSGMVIDVSNNSSLSFSLSANVSDTSSSSTRSASAVLSSIHIE